MMSHGPVGRLAATLLAVLCAVPVAAATAPAPARAAAPEDAAAAVYRQALLLNTPFMESTWDAAAGTYRIQDFYFAGEVLGSGGEVGAPVALGVFGPAGGAAQADADELYRPAAGEADAYPRLGRRCRGRSGGTSSPSSTTR